MNKASKLIDFSPCLVLVGGPSGIGKTSIINELISTFDDIYTRPVSFTSRDRRPQENNAEYVFVSREDILRMETSGEILTIDYVYENMYAISRKSVNKIISQNKVAIKEVHPKNHSKIRSIVNDLVSVLLIPANFPENLGESDFERDDRRKEDVAYYTNLTLSTFDIVMEVDKDHHPSTLAKELHLYIKSHLSTRRYFPPSHEIDSTNATGYAKAAPEFNENARITTRNFHELSEQYFSDSAHNYMISGMKCLELGIGHGWLSSIVSFEGVEYEGVDISPEMIRHSKVKSGTQSSARRLSYPSNHFDIVFASLADPYFYPAALLEVRRVMKPDGLFIFSTPSRQWSEGIREKNSQDKTMFKLSDGSTSEVYSFTFSQQDLEQLLTACGLEIKNSFVACGEELLSSGKEISPAITASAEKQNIAVGELPILNFVVARKVI